DYILYAIQYVNPWHGNYLRRGKDVITGKEGYSDLDDTVTRQAEFVEKDEVKLVHTASLNTVVLDLVFQDLDGTNIPCSLVLTFNDEGKCTIRSGTEGITATGNGSFVSKGEKNSWGSKDRDAIYLSYEIDMPLMQVVTTDTLVLRDRGVGMETFSTVYKAN
ncbi:MAG: DUF5627 domain-containing protein, partial [Bacteroidales bacterium]|nr:DUF5627 domain-containing protein [Bacteroidales bacterium]